MRVVVKNLVDIFNAHQQYVPPLAMAWASHVSPPQLKTRQANEVETRPRKAHGRLKWRGREENC